LKGNSCTAMKACLWEMSAMDSDMIWHGLDGLESIKTAKLIYFRDYWHNFESIIFFLQLFSTKLNSFYTIWRVWTSASYLLCSDEARELLLNEATMQTNFAMEKNVTKIKNKEKYCFTFSGLNNVWAIKWKGQKLFLFLWE
jgi:hypothetical protein